MTTSELGQNTRLPGAQQTISLGGRLGIRRRSLVFTMVTLCCLVPVLWTTVARNHANTRALENMSAAQNARDDFGRIRLRLSDVESSLWRLRSSPTRDVGRLVRSSLNALSASVLRRRPVLMPEQQSAFREMADATERLRRQVDPLLSRGALERDQVRIREALNAIGTLQSIVVTEDARLKDNYERAYRRAQEQSSNTTRDALLTLLMIVSLGAVALFVVPAWVTEPLNGFLTLSRRIRQNKAANIKVVGDNELAEVAKSVKQAVSQHSQLELKKTGKLLELRKLIRAVTEFVDAPAFIVQPSGRIDYVNTQATQLMDVEAHQLEGTFIHNVERLTIEDFPGVLLDSVEPLSIWVNGRHYLVSHTVVHDRTGQASRYVLVFDLVVKEGKE